MQGVGADAGPASTVAAEIVAAGGDAIADTNDISTPAGAQALVDAAVARFGRVDVLVNNAGIIRWKGMPEVDADNVLQHFAVHTLGSFNTTRAAWPHMVEQGYGRIVMTSSSGIFGLLENLSYATAKAGGDRPHAQPHDRRRAARHQGQRDHARGDDAHGRPLRRRDRGARQRRRVHQRRDGARARRADGRVPRPRGLPGERRDLRGRRRPLRARLPRDDAGLRERRRRPSRTSPSTGRRSTTRPATPSRPTSWTGRRSS